MATIRRRGERKFELPPEGQFPALPPEEQVHEVQVAPTESRWALLTSRARTAVATRLVLLSVVAALYLQYYFYDVMNQIYAMPGIVVNIPPRQSVLIPGDLTS